MIDTMIKVEFYSSLNSAWVDVSKYVLSIGMMPQILNNRDFSLTIPNLSITVGTEINNLLTSYDNQLMDLVITAVRVYKPDFSFLYFKGVFYTCQLSKDKFTYAFVFNHDLQLLKNQIFTRDRYNASLLQPLEENVYWKDNNIFANTYSISPNQFFRKLISIDMGVNCETSELEISLNSTYVDRGAAFAINQDVCSNGANFEADKNGTAFDVLDNLCRQLLCYLTYDQASFGNYKIVFPADYDNSYGRRDDRVFTPSDNNQLVIYAEKTGSYLRSLNMAVNTFNDTNPWVGNPYENPTGTPTENTSSYTSYPGGIKYTNVSLKSNCFIGSLSATGYLGAIKGVDTAKTRYSQKVKEYEYTVPVQYSMTAKNIIKHDITLDNSKGLLSKITSELQQYNRLIIGAYTANDTGNAILSARYETNTAWLARRVPGYDQTWYSPTQDDVPGYVWYKFDFRTQIKADKFECYSWLGATKCTLQGSNNDSTWTDIGVMNIGTINLLFASTVKYRYYRLYWLEADRTIPTDPISLNKPQFYERIL